MPTCLSNSSARSFACLRLTFRCARIAATICVPIVKTGLSALVGSWKIMLMAPPRTSRICASDSVVSSRPSSLTLPSVLMSGPSRRMAASAEMLLPLPLSPTTCGTGGRRLKARRLDLKHRVDQFTRRDLPSQ